MLVTTKKSPISDLSVLYTLILVSSNIFISGKESIELEPDALSTKNNSESQILHCLENIEKQVATLAMEKALKFILEYHEGKKKSNSTPVAG